MNRREFLKTAGASGSAMVLAGCQATQTDETPADTEAEAPGTTTGTPAEEAGTLVVATYDEFIDAPSSSPGAWLKDQFEAETGAELLWQTPPNGANYFIERANADVETDADVYVGLNTDDLIRIDENLEDGSLFVEPDDLAGQSSVREELQFDPMDRAVPYDTGYISLVWDATADDGQFVAPETFDGLLDSEYEGDLLAQNPSSATGRAFLLHTVHEKGPDGFVDYWERLRDNDVTVLGDWDTAYSAYGDGEAPIVVSYSTDQVFANRFDQNMERHQIRFLNDQGYANPEGMAQLEGAANPDLARQFMEFMLRPEVQGEIAVRNVQFPATTDADLPEEYSTYAKVPPEPVTFTYDELKGSVDEWTDEWQRAFTA